MEYLEREYKSVLVHLCMAYRTASGADIDMELTEKKHGRARVEVDDVLYSVDANKISLEDT